MSATVLLLKLIEILQNNGIMAHPLTFQKTGKLWALNITVMHTKIRTKKFKNSVHSLLGSLQAASLWVVSTAEFQSAAMELDCNNLELDRHWHRSNLKCVTKTDIVIYI